MNRYAVHNLFLRATSQVAATFDDCREGQISAHRNVFALCRGGFDSGQKDSILSGIAGSVRGFGINRSFDCFLDS